MADFQAWYNQTIGKQVDIDGAFGDQCVDIAMSWAQFCFPGHQWPELLGYGNAKDLYGASNPDFFDKLPNQKANQGDMVVFGATSTNPYGHIAVVISDDGTTMAVIEQNGFNPSGVAYVAYRPHNNIIGFLRPKGQGGMMMVDKNLLINYYQTLFNRQPDPAAQGWLGQPADVVFQSLIISDEYKAIQAQRAAQAQLLAQLQAGKTAEDQQVKDLTAKVADLTAQVKAAQVTTGPLDQATKDQITSTNSIVQQIWALLSRVFK